MLSYKFTPPKTALTHRLCGAHRRVFLVYSRAVRVALLFAVFGCDSILTAMLERKMFSKSSASTRSAFILLILFFIGFFASASARQSKDKKDEKKKVEPFKIEKLTQGMGLYSLGPLSPDKKTVLLIAKKPEASPNLYRMNLADFSIQPLTAFQWGVADPQWSPDGASVAFAGFNETATFSDLYTLDLKKSVLRRLTSNNFSDKQPAYAPDGKRLYFTTDESPLPDAAFGILHVAVVQATGGKSEYFTEDEVSTILPCLAADGKSLLLVKIDELSGRHSLWQYGLDGKPLRNLTERKFARIHRYIMSAANNLIVIWGQEEPEQQDGVYILDSKSGDLRSLPEGDLPKRNPAVSPDGSLIAFVSQTATGAHIYLFDSKSGQIQQLTYKGFLNYSPAFIADDRILFGSNRDNENEIYSLNLSSPVKDEKKDKK
jgi:Tol biopolymer transport system component